MAVGVRRYQGGGPFTRPVSEPVKIGQLVMYDTANPGYVKVNDGTGHCCGMATTSANPDDTAPTAMPDASWPQEDLAIARTPEIAVLRFSQAANPGDTLVGDTGGRVKPGTTGQIVGDCMGTAKDGVWHPVVAGGEGDVALRV